MIAKTVLPFKLEPTDESITPQAGLALLGEFMKAIGLAEEVARFLPKAGSGRGYEAWAFVQPILLMLHAGGVCLEDLRKIAGDKGLMLLLGIEGVPSPDAVGDFLRRMGRKGSGGLKKLLKRALKKALAADRRKAFTLDADASGIEANKKEAFYTYQGTKGYLPVIGHLAENGLIVFHDFREGNEAPSDGQLPFLHACLDAMPRGKRITAYRADAASYQGALFETLTHEGIAYAVGARMDAAVKAAILSIPKEAWRPFEDGLIAETRHKMNGMATDFRLIVFKRPGRGCLFGESEGPTVAIASTKGGTPEKVLTWYRARGEHSENRIKELKLGFGMERMPCGQFGANATFFSLGVLAYNLYKSFLQRAMPKGFEKRQVQSMRYLLYHVAAKVVRHAGALILKISLEALNLFHRVRRQTARLAFAASG